jgi:hypothetical protein
LQVLQPQPFEVLSGRKTLDAVSIALVGALVIPEPMLAPVGKNYEGAFRFSA